MTALQEKTETAGADAIQKFKASQLFIDSCADYYGTGFDDCPKQVALTFPELDLSGISMDTPEPVMPVRDVANDDDVVLESQPSPLADDDVILAQPTVTHPVPVSKTPEPTVDIDGALLQSGGNPADVLDVWRLFYLL